MTTITLRDTSGAFGSAATRRSAGTISVLPLPPICRIVCRARSMLARVAGTEAGASIRFEPEKSMTLKVSLGRSDPIRRSSSALLVSSG